MSTSNSSEVQSLEALWSKDCHSEPRVYQERFPKKYYSAVFLAIPLTVIMSSCGWTIQNRATSPSRTTVSREIASDRVRFNASSEVWFDGRRLGTLDPEKPPQYGGRYPPKVLPDGTSGYQQTDLGDGRIFLSGGYATNKSGDPPKVVGKTLIWRISKRLLESGPAMNCARAMHEAKRLPDGRVVLFGGISDTINNRYTGSVEIFNPATKSITPGGELLVARLFPASIFLDGERLVVAGGQVDADNESMETRQVEIYNVGSAKSAFLGELCFDRQDGSLLRLSDTELLLVGGFNSNSETKSHALPPEIIRVQ